MRNQILKKQSFLRIISIIVVCFVATFLGCSEKKTPQKEQTQFNVGIVTWPGFGPLFVADKNGYFKEEGLKLNISIIEDEAARRSAFATGQLDIAANTVDALASSAPKGVDGIVFLKTDDSFGADGLIAKKSITSISQLKGKKVAYPKGLPSHYFLYELLKENNLSISDIKSVYMEASDAGAAFAAGKIDAAVTWEPWLSQGTSVGNILFTTKDKPGLIADVLMVRKEIFNDHRDALTSFLKAWFKGLQFIQSNKKEAIKYIATGLKLPVEDTEWFMTLVKFSDLNENIQFFEVEGSSSVCMDIFSKASDLWLAENIIEKKADPNAHCNGSLIRDIIK